MNPGWDDGWITVADLDRALLATHPWSLSGGGAVATERSNLRPASAAQLSAKIVPPIGRAIRAGADEAFVPTVGLRRSMRAGMPSTIARSVTGEESEIGRISHELNDLCTHTLTAQAVALTTGCSS